MPDLRFNCDPLRGANFERPIYEIFQRFYVKSFQSLMAFKPLTYERDHNESSKEIVTRDHCTISENGTYVNLRRWQTQSHTEPIDKSAENDDFVAFRRCDQNPSNGGQWWSGNNCVFSSDEMEQGGCQNASTECTTRWNRTFDLINENG